MQNNSWHQQQIEKDRQQRENERQRSMIQAQQGGNFGLHNQLSFIKTNQNPRDYNYAVDQTVRRYGHK